MNDCPSHLDFRDLVAVELVGDQSGEEFGADFALAVIPGDDFVMGGPRVWVDEVAGFAGDCCVEESLFGGGEQICEVDGGHRRRSLWFWVDAAMVPAVVWWW